MGRVTLERRLWLQVVVTYLGVAAAYPRPVAQPVVDTYPSHFDSRLERHIPTDRGGVNCPC